MGTEVKPLDLMLFLKNFQLVQVRIITLSLLNIEPTLTNQIHYSLTGLCMTEDHTTLS